MILFTISRSRSRISRCEESAGCGVRITSVSTPPGTQTPSRLQITSAAGSALARTDTVIVCHAAPHSPPSVASPSTTSGNSFIHIPIFQNPHIDRLSQTISIQYVDCRLFESISDAALVNYQQSSTSPVQPGLFILDGSWNRIVYAEDGYNCVKSWGDSDPNPRLNLQIPVALVSDCGNFASEDWKVNMYVAE